MLQQIVVKVQSFIHIKNYNKSIKQRTEKVTKKGVKSSGYNQQESDTNKKRHRRIKKIFNKGSQGSLIEALLPNLEKGAFILYCELF